MQHRMLQSSPSGITVPTVGAEPYEKVVSRVCWYRTVKLSVGEILRCKVRYFSDGMTFGSRDFVNKVFKDARERFGAKRKSGARLLKGFDWQKTQTRLYSMRQLTNSSIGQLPPH